MLISRSNLFESNFSPQSNIHCNISTNRVVLPGEQVAIDVEHRRDVKVHVLHHLFHFIICFMRLQDLIQKSKEMIGTIFYPVVWGLWFSYLFDEVLTECWSDPFSGMNTTVHPDSLLLCFCFDTNLENKIQCPHILGLFKLYDDFFPPHMKSDLPSTM